MLREILKKIADRFDFVAFLRSIYFHNAMPAQAVSMNGLPHHKRSL